MASLPHPQVLRTQLHPPELGVPQALNRACEIHISALICLSSHVTGLSEVLPVLEPIPVPLSYVPLNQKKPEVLGRSLQPGLTWGPSHSEFAEGEGKIDPEQ